MNFREWLGKGAQVNNAHGWIIVLVVGHGRTKWESLLSDHIYPTRDEAREERKRLLGPNRWIREDGRLEIRKCYIKITVPT